MPYGHGDPSIPPLATARHDAACAQGRAMYRDPATGYAVFTADRLRAAGRCCAAGCRHCPFSAEEQRAAGRQSARPD